MKRSLVVLGLVTAAALLLCCVARAPSAQAVDMFHLDWSTGANPMSVAVGDFNGDGNKDLVTANSPANTVSVLLGTGSGGFGVKTDFAVVTSPYSVAVGDFDNDGKQDLAVASFGTSKVGVLIGVGDGSFAMDKFGIAPSTGTGPMSVAVGDFNKDGKKDLATANYTANTVSVLIGDGSCGFVRTLTDPAVGTNPNSVVVGDFNRDGKQDLATANYSADTVSVLLGDGSGAFTRTATDPATGDGPSSVAVGDFNHDGRQDLVTTNEHDGTVSVLLGRGTGGFFAKRDFATDYGPWSVAIGDFNGDTRQDLAVANSEADEAHAVSVLLGNGRGGFGGRTDFSDTMGPSSVAVGDFNRDGKPDLAVTNFIDPIVSVLQNTSRPRIHSLRPTRGRVGATLTITGWGFGATRGIHIDKVYFGGKAAAKYISWSAGKIRVRVPHLAQGRVAVRVETYIGRSNLKYFKVL